MMTEMLSCLLAVQACDQRIQEATHTLAALEQALVSLKEDDEVKAQEIRALQTRLSEAAQRQAALTVQIEEVKRQVRDRKHDLHWGRPDEPEDAGLRAIAFLEAHRIALEEERRTLVAQHTDDAEALRQAEALVLVQQEERQHTAFALLDQITAATEARRRAQEERVTLVGGVQAAPLQEYERIFARRGGVALVALTHETCQGCHLRLPPQLCLDLPRRPMPTFCPHCQRILFVPHNTTIPAAAPPSPAPPAKGHGAHQLRRQPRAKAQVEKRLREAEVPPSSPAPR
jgi:predicted  nucleic acid-binding Zn-ribbon protein